MQEVKSLAALTFRGFWTLPLFPPIFIFDLKRLNFQVLLIKCKFSYFVAFLDSFR